LARPLEAESCSLRKPRASARCLAECSYAETSQCGSGGNTLSFVATMHMRRERSPCQMENEHGKLGCRAHRCDWMARRGSSGAHIRTGISLRRYLLMEGGGKKIRVQILRFSLSLYWALQTKLLGTLCSLR